MYMYDCCWLVQAKDCEVEAAAEEDEVVLEVNAIEEDTDEALEDDVDGAADELEDEDEDEEATEELLDDEACEDDDDCEVSELLFINKDGAVALDGRKKLTEDV